MAEFIGSMIGYGFALAAFVGIFVSMIGWLVGLLWGAINSI